MSHGFLLAVAERLGIAESIDFICTNTMTRASVETDTYDLVYTSNGVHVWINDLNAMYENIRRVLKPNGISIMFDIHPLQRPFDEQMKIYKAYDYTGSFEDETSVTFHWRIQDTINAIHQKRRVSMELYLIRHGECYPSAPQYYDLNNKAMNPPLTERGILQAKELSSRIANIHFDKIYSSDLLRAVQTAHFLKDLRSVELILMKEFREIDMGELNLKSWDAYPELYQEWRKHDTDVAYPGGECGADVWERCNLALQSILKEDLDRVAIVCHGGTIMSILCGVLNIPQEKRFFFGHPIENCSISVINYIDEQYYIHSINTI